VNLWQHPYTRWETLTTSVYGKAAPFLSYLTKLRPPGAASVDESDGIEAAEPMQVVEHEISLARRIKQKHGWRGWIVEPIPEAPVMLDEHIFAEVGRADCSGILVKTMEHRTVSGL
jgi:hypothetical protein